jgi:hypothetical protein
MTSDLVEVSCVQILVYMPVKLLNRPGFRDCFPVRSDWTREYSATCVGMIACSPSIDDL